MNAKNLLEKSFRFGFLILFLTFSFFSTTQATEKLTVFSQTSNSISGFVFNSERRPLANIQVELLDEYNSLIARTKTNGSGRYSFSGINQGRFYVHVMTIGTNLLEQTKDVEIINFSRQSRTGQSIISGSENVQKDFFLQVKQNPDNVSFTNSVVFAQVIPQNAQKFYEKAIADLNSQKFTEGLEELISAIEIFPDYFLALQRLGQEYIRLESYEQAKLCFARATQINPKSFESFYGLSYAYEKLNENNEALTAIKKSIELNSNSVETFYLQGLILKKLTKYKEAEESLIKAKKLSPKPFAAIHWQLALIYTNNLKNYSAAADELQLFLKASPNYEETDKVKELIKKLREKKT